MPSELDVWLVAGRARAKQAIRDNPLSGDDGSTRRGAIGTVDDVADGFVWVDFGDGSIPCDPDEIVPYF